MRKLDIDSKDIEIINILQENANISNVELAEKIGLSQGPTLVRVQNLFKKGVIQSYAATIKLSYFGFTTSAYIRVNILKQDAEKLETRALAERRVIRLQMVNRPFDLGVIADTYIAAILGRSAAECKKVFDELIKDLSIVSSEDHIASKIIKARPLELVPDDANPKRKATE